MCLRYILFLLCLFFSTVLISQQLPPGVSQQQIRAQLAQKGISEDDVQQRLKEKGFDINNLKPEDIPAFQKALEETIAELEREATQAVGEVTSDIIQQKTSEQLNEEIQNKATAIGEKVEAGVPVKEAISEEILSDSEEGPRAVIYGHHIFRDGSINTFRQSDDIRPPDTYLLGPGDQLAISIFGASFKNEVLTINKEGFVQPDRMPRIYLNGINFGRSKELLRKRYRSNYLFNPSEFSVVLNYSRTITVNIVGDVLKPGSYTLPAINTAFNALTAADGPSNIGSVRKIQLIRSGVQPQEIDVYQFLFDPSFQENFYLQDGDYIYIPVAEKVVTISGAVKRPFAYELKAPENLKALIQFAGGLSDNAFQKNIQVKRFVDDEEIIIDVNLRDILSSDQDFELFSGDVIRIPAIPLAFENKVEISGAVALPGTYELSPGLRLLDLITRAELRTNAKLDIGYLIRQKTDGNYSYERKNFQDIINNPGSPENIFLQERDRVLILAQNTFTDRANVKVNGAVRDPNSYPYNREAGLRISDALNLAGGLSPNASAIAYIYRKDDTRKKHQEYLRIDIADVALNSGSAQNILLEPFDSIYIFPNEYFTDQANVSVLGAVRNPGAYPFDSTLNLKDIITQAGGLSLSGAKNRIEISRVMINDNEPTQTVVASVEVDENFNVVSGSEATLSLQPFDQVIVRHVPEFELQKNVQINGEVVYPGTYPLISENEKLSSIIQRAGGLSAEAFPEGATIYRTEDNIGFVVTKLQEVMTNPSSDFNLIMKEGDRIDIPKQKDIVTIEGATNAIELYPERVVAGGKFSTAFVGRKRAKWYVNEFAAGVGENGSTKRIAVEYPNGEIKKTKSFLFITSSPPVEKGSKIRVGYKPPKPEKEKTPGSNERIDWGKVVADSMAQATAVLTLILLVQRLN